MKLSAKQRDRGHEAAAAGFKESLFCRMMLPDPAKQTFLSGKVMDAIEIESGKYTGSAFSTVMEDTKVRREFRAKVYHRVRNDPEVYGFIMTIVLIAILTWVIKRILDVLFPL